MMLNSDILAVALVQRKWSKAYLTSINGAVAIFGTVLFFKMYLPKNAPFLAPIGPLGNLDPTLKNFW